MEVSLRNRQEDLDDHEGELLKFLPSDIFPLDQHPQVLPPLSSSIHNPLNCSNRNCNHSSVSDISSCVDLSQGLAAFSFVGPCPHPPQRFHIMPAANLMLGLADQRSFPGSFPNHCCCICGESWIVGANQVSHYGAGDGAGGPSYGPVRHPVQSQIDRFMEQRARFLQAMHDHCWVNRATERRIFPSRSGGVGFLGGTGVYLPRIPAANINSTIANHTDHPRSRRQRGRNGRRDDDEAHSHKKKQEAFRSNASPEMGLPDEWTY